MCDFPRTNAAFLRLSSGQTLELADASPTVKGDAEMLEETRHSEKTGDRKSLLKSCEHTDGAARKV